MPKRERRYIRDDTQRDLSRAQLMLMNSTACLTEIAADECYERDVYWFARMAGHFAPDELKRPGDPNSGGA